MAGNLFAVGSSPADTIDLIGQGEIKSSTLHKSNKRAHELAIGGRKAGMSAVNAALAAAEQIRRESSSGGGSLPAKSTIGPASSAQSLSIAARAAKRIKADALATELRGRSRDPAASSGEGASMAPDHSGNLSGWGPGQRARFASAVPLVPPDRRVVWSSRGVAEQAMASVHGPDFAETHTGLTGRVVKSATDSYLTGFALMCGAFSPADVAERLCSWRSDDGDISKATLLVRFSAWAEGYVASLL
ncbi:hypothetical protein I4F81_001773 [Pyropia yezoensis]|uniref:Uncharacterized protein n=1 Tax=Pyropia yezoensis TaxID=2788 RepID=A0ACC3BNV8_PYRYE|nr:hypothetical protein I4F81_001773 [Neopyropia yezoensis]